MIDLPVPAFDELEGWAGAGRVHRATGAEVADWLLPGGQKEALVRSGVPVFEELVHGVSFGASPAGYRLAYFDDRDERHRVAWDYTAVPGTGEVRDGTRLVNSTVSHWLCALHLVGSWFRESTVIHRWDEDEEAEERALAEIDDLLRRIGEIDPAAIGDGHHETHFWPAVLGRWLW